MTVTLEEAIELLQKKQEAEAQKHIKKFEEEPELEILNGRYGLTSLIKAATTRFLKTSSLKT